MAVFSLQLVILIQQNLELFYPNSTSISRFQQEEHISWTKYVYKY